MQTAYFMWVSDFQTLYLCHRPTARRSRVVLVPSGTATIYYTDTPASRDLTNVRDTTTRASWGDPVATFTRHAGHLQTADNFASDNMVFWAELVSSKSFTILNGNQFNFKDLIPYGMTCYREREEFQHVGGHDLCRRRRARRTAFLATDECPPPVGERKAVSRRDAGLWNDSSRLSKPEAVMILVVGATAFLGSEICRSLRAGGHPVRALARAGSGRGKVQALPAVVGEHRAAVRRAA